MSRFEFALAGPADDAELRQRMAEDWMEGEIAISFRREPSYFAGCRIQGDSGQVVKCTDTHSGRIVGMGSRLVSSVHINGRPRRVGYLADLRTMREHRHGTLLARGYRFLRELHRSDPLPFYLTVIFDSNAAALQSLVGERAGLPHYGAMGRILTPAIHLDFARPGLSITGVEFGRATATEMPQIRDFLRHQAASRQFSPAYAEADFGVDGRLGALRAGDFFVARTGGRVGAGSGNGTRIEGPTGAAGRIVACVAAWDQSALRQTHIERYSTPLRLTRPFYNLASALSPLKPLPAPGAKLPLVYLCCIAVQDNDALLFRALLRHAYNALRTGPWHYAIAGLHEHDPLAQVLAEYRRIAAAGHLFVVHYPEDGDPRTEFDGRTRYVEMALA
jgi:hypothetical protein